MVKKIKFYSVVSYSGKEPFTAFHGTWKECRNYVKNSDKNIKKMLDIQFDYEDVYIE